MNKKILILFFLVITKTAFLQSKIDSNLRDYLFTEGSFWVYEKEDSSVIDSLVVTNVKLDYTPPVWTMGMGMIIIYPIPYYQVDYESKTLNYQTWDQFFSGYIIKEGIDWPTNNQVVFLSSYRIGDEELGAKIVDTLNSMIIGTNEFYDVTKMLIYSNRFENDHPTHFYYSKGVGLIRKEILSMDTVQIEEAWNLINWHVNQSATISIKEYNSDFSIRVYPNPAKDFIQIKVNWELDPETQVYLYNINGQVVSHQIIQSIDSEIDISKIDIGVYIVEVLNKHKVARFKIVKN